MSRRVRKIFRCSVTTCVGTLGSQRSRNIAEFGHRFCRSRAPFSRSHDVRRIRSLPSNLANLLFVSPPPPPPATCSFVPSFHRGGSNKSSGFYSCLSDILYSAGPGGLLSYLPIPFFRSFPRLRTCAIRYKTQATVYMRKIQGTEVYKWSSMFRALLIGQFTRCAFSCFSRSRRHIATVAIKYKFDFSS